MNHNQHQVAKISSLWFVLAHPFHFHVVPSHPITTKALGLSMYTKTLVGSSLNAMPMSTCCSTSYIGHVYRCLPRNNQQSLNITLTQPQPHIKLQPFVVSHRTLPSYLGLGIGLARPDSECKNWYSKNIFWRARPKSDNGYYWRATTFVFMQKLNLSLS